MSELLIPKTIHYCWFGNNPKPESVLKCIESWKKYCPDFEIKEWNESNYDIHKHPYMQKAYEEKKWAFVPDYARLDIMYEHGGIYLDTDVEVIKDLSPLCELKAFKGFENDQVVNDGQGFGCMPHLPILKEMIACYDGNEPYEMVEGKLQNIESPRLCTKVLLRHGLKQDGKRQKVGDIDIFPTEYFCPKSFATGLINITDNTYSIHHFDASWHDKKGAKYIALMRGLNRAFGEKVGMKLFKGLMDFKDSIKRIIK